MSDKDLAAIFSLNGKNGRPGQLEAFDDFNAVGTVRPPWPLGS